MQRVALVYPYFRTHAPTELLFSPLGVAYLAAELHEAGIEEAHTFKRIAIQLQRQQVTEIRINIQ